MDHETVVNIDKTRKIIMEPSEDYSTLKDQFMRLLELHQNQKEIIARLRTQNTELLQQLEEMDRELHQR